MPTDEMHTADTFNAMQHDQLATKYAELFGENRRLAEFARWLASLDDPDPASTGRQDRQTINLNQIIERARVALGEKD